MLEALRQNSRSFIIWILFGIIIAVFVISFGPQAGPDSLGCGASSEYAARVSGQSISVHSWRFAMNGLGFGSGTGNSEQAVAKRQQAIDFLVEREILAQEAGKLGFAVSTDQVNEMVAKGEFWLMGRKVTGKNAYYTNDYFDFKAFERMVLSLGLPSVPVFVEEQKRELLANIMRDSVIRSSLVSSEETESRYVQRNTKVTIEYVKFMSRNYGQLLPLTDDMLTKYAESHAAELKEKWEGEKVTYADDKLRVRARHIFLQRQPVTEVGESKDPEAAKKAAMDEARARAADAAARLKKGDAFSLVAREMSDDARTKMQGGSFGWKPASSIPFGNEIVEAIKTLEPGQTSEIIETARGFHIAHLDERSEKGLTFEQMKLDLARTEASRYYGKLLAYAAAKKALELTTTVPLNEQFETAQAPAAAPNNGLPSQDEQTKKLMEQLQKSGGKLTPEMIEKLSGGANAPSMPALPEGFAPPTPGAPSPMSPPMPIPGAPIPGAPSPTPGAPAPSAPVPVPPTPAGPRGGFLYWESENIPAQGEEPAAPTPLADVESPEDKARREMEQIAKDLGTVDLTQAGELAKDKQPTIRSVGPINRSGDYVAGIGKSEELVGDVFDRLDVGKTSDKIYPALDDFVLVRLTKRAEADMEAYGDEAAQLRSDFRREKGTNLLVDWILDSCTEIAKSGQIDVNREYLAGQDSKAEVVYQPCKSISYQSVMGQVSLWDL